MSANIWEVIDKHIYLLIDTDINKPCQVIVENKGTNLDPGPYGILKLISILSPYPIALSHAFCFGRLESLRELKQKGLVDFVFKDNYEIEITITDAGQNVLEFGAMSL